MYERRDGLIKNRHIIADFLKLKYFDNFIKIYVISCWYFLYLINLFYGKTVFICILYQINLILVGAFLLLMKECFT